MSKRRRLSGFVGLPAAVLMVYIQAEAQTADEIRVNEVSPGLFAVVGPSGNGNVAFLTTKEGVLVISLDPGPYDR